MKLIIDIEPRYYKNMRSEVKELYYEAINRITEAVSNGIPYEERPQGEFTDLEQKVIADSINYILGAELLEENGYTEEVVNALKSVLQKIGAEEDHL